MSQAISHSEHQAKTPLPGNNILISNFLDAVFSAFSVLFSESPPFPPFLAEAAHKKIPVFPPRLG